MSGADTGSMKMHEAVLVGNGMAADGIFRLDSAGNRDGCYEPYVLLAQRLRARGFEIHTPDCVSTAPAFELHMDVQRGQSAAPCFLLLLETPMVCPLNADIPSHYRKVFTWNDALVDGDRFIKINLPNPLAIAPVDGMASRPRFCCLIAGNKAGTVHDPRLLYSERVRAIRWFEKNAPADFDLFGIDWDLPPPRPGFVGKVVKRLWRDLSRVVGMKPFPSYRGRVERKRDVLQQTRFSICYENVRDMPGYITEKIFDSFFAGCVPVYLGAGNVADHIPADCFIDRRRFGDMPALYAYLKAMSDDDYRGYQQRIAAFIAGDKARPFGIDAFAKTIVDTIVQDLGSENISPGRD